MRTRYNRTLQVSQIILMIELRIRDIDMTEVSSIMGIPTPGGTRTIDHLVKMGLVSRGASKEDRRKIYIALTRKGREFVDLITINPPPSS